MVNLQAKRKSEHRDLRVKRRTRITKALRDGWHFVSKKGPSDVSERIAERAEDAVNAGRRVPKQRMLTNVSSLGEIHLVDSDQEADCSSCLTVCSVGSLRANRSHCATRRLLSGGQLASWSGVLLSSEGG